MLSFKKFIHKYAGFVLNALQEAYAYRLRLFIWMLNDLIVLFVQYFLWKAIFESADGRIHTIGLEQYLFYVAFTLLFSRLVSAQIDGDIAQEIKRGNIAMHLVRPYNYFVMTMSRRLGSTLGNAVVLIPVMLVVGFLVGLPGIGLSQILYTVLSMSFAYVLVSLFYFILGILAFWLTNYWGLFLFKQHIIALFSGELIALNLLFLIGNGAMLETPIPFLDHGFMKTAFLALGYSSYALPFQAMSYTPSAIFTGMISGTEQIHIHLGIQALWILLLSVLTAILWRRAQRRITIMGG